MSLALLAQGCWTIRRVVDSWVYAGKHIVMSDSDFILERPVEVTSQEAGELPIENMPEEVNTWINIKMAEGTVTVSLKFRDDEKPSEEEAMMENTRIDLTLSTFLEGFERSVALCTAPGRFKPKTRKGLHGAQHETKHGISSTWVLDPDSASMRALRKAAEVESGVLVRITGYPTRFAKAPSHEQILPVVPEIRLPLISLASLITSPDSDYITLAPTIPSNEKRVLRAHIKILCDASSYFDSLFRSGFSEGEYLRQRTQVSAVAGTAKASSSVFDKLVAKVLSSKDRRTEQGGDEWTRPMPVVRVPEVSYSELETLLFYVHTGVAAFARRDRSVRNTGTAFSFAQRFRRSESSVSKDPWWNGVLEPASAFDMYRIADKYGITGLCQEALGHIRSELMTTRSNPVQLLKDVKSHKEIGLFPELSDLYQEAFELKDDGVLLHHWKNFMSTLDRR